MIFAIARSYCTIGYWLENNFLKISRNLFFNYGNQFSIVLKTQHFDYFYCQNRANQVSVLNKRSHFPPSESNFCSVVNSDIFNLCVYVHNLRHGLQLAFNLHCFLMRYLAPKIYIDKLLFYAKVALKRHLIILPPPPSPKKGSF